MPAKYIVLTEINRKECLKLARELDKKAPLQRVKRDNIAIRTGRLYVSQATPDEVQRKVEPVEISLDDYFRGVRTIFSDGIVLENRHPVTTEVVSANRVAELIQKDGNRAKELVRQAGGIEILLDQGGEYRDKIWEVGGIMRETRGSIISDFDRQIIQHLALLKIKIDRDPNLNNDPYIFERWKRELLELAGRLRKYWISKNQCDNAVRTIVDYFGQPIIEMAKTELFMLSFDSIAQRYGQPDSARVKMRMFDAYDVSLFEGENPPFHQCKFLNRKDKEEAMALAKLYFTSRKGNRRDGNTVKSKEKGLKKKYIGEQGRIDLIISLATDFANYVSKRGVEGQ